MFVCYHMIVCPLFCMFMVCFNYLLVITCSQILFTLAYPFYLYLSSCVVIPFCNDHQNPWCEQIWEPLVIIVMMRMLHSSPAWVGFRSLEHLLWALLLGCFNCSVSKSALNCHPVYIFLLTLFCAVTFLPI